jgi:putative GTP pyrophosphokinase
MTIRFSEDEFAKVKNMLHIYEWGQRTLLTKLNIMYEDFKNFSEYNPIENIKGRIKSPESIATKLYNLDVDITAQNAKAHLKDIAGIRIICSYAKDIYYLIDLLRAMPEVKILNEKDYIGNPKSSGYRSYHVITEIPVFYSGKTESVIVEIQIRTEGMNFWSTLEHKARYKFQERIPGHLGDELELCAKKIAELDQRMYLIHEAITLINEERS